MKKFVYLVEFVIVVWLVLPLSLNYTGKMSIILPDSYQIKNAISVTSSSSSSNIATNFNPSTPACENPTGSKTGFPFVYKTNNGCGQGTNYSLGQWLDYGAVVILALIVIKLTSMMINFVVSQISKNQ
jgi:hypothetical protein